MSVYRLALVALLTAKISFLSAQITPEITVTDVIVDGSDYSMIEVHYSLSSDATDSVSIHAMHSNDGGLSFSQVNNLAGDFEKPVANGNRVLSYESASPAAELEDIRVKVVAVSRFSPSIHEMVEQVQVSELQDIIDVLEGERNYGSNPSRMDSIKDYLEAEMSTYLDVSRLDFSFGAFNGQNFVSEQKGLVDPLNVAINGAHFDGVIGSPGADDNASGIAGVLEAARILSQYQFENSIRYLLFDLEELGLRGSVDYTINDLSNDETILGAIINEMIAYSDSSVNSQQFPAGFSLLFPAAYNEVAADSFRGNFITNVGNTASASLMASYKNAALEYVPTLKVIDVEAPGTSQTVPDLRRSDHAPFWDAGHQALMITDGANFRNPNYHEASDSLSTLDLNFMKAVVQANIAALASLAIPLKAGTDESAYTSILGVENVNSKANECFKLQSANPSKSGLSIYKIESCEQIQSFEIKVSDVTGRTIHEAHVRKRDDFQLEVSFENRASALYIIHGTINGTPFSERVVW